MLDDGCRHRIVKRFWMPDRFETELDALGRHARAHDTEFFFLPAWLDRPAAAAS